MADKLLFSDLEGQICLALLVREHWFMSNCHGQAAALYLQLEKSGWVEIVPSTDEACWQVQKCDPAKLHDEFLEDGSHYRIRDAGKSYRLTGVRVARIYQKKLGQRIEICLEFSNATDLTLHYNLVTHESSLYFIKES